jgi:hypothetical protein
MSQLNGYLSDLCGISVAHQTPCFDLVEMREIEVNEGEDESNRTGEGRGFPKQSKRVLIFTGLIFAVYQQA